MSEDIQIINQNTRVEKLKIFFSKNFKKLVVIIVSILFILFSYFGYLEYKKTQKRKTADSYNQITLNEKKVKNSVDIEKLIEIIKKKDSVYSTLSLYFIIENNLVDDKDEINNFFDIVIDAQDEKEIENLIVYKKAMYNADTASENELLEILNPLLKSDSVWKPHSLLLMSDYFARNDNLIKSKEFLKEIISSEIVINNDIKIEAERRLKRELSD